MRIWKRRATDDECNRITEQESLMAGRIMNGLTRAQIAERCGRSVEQVLAFERGETDPTLSELRRYAHAAGVLVLWHVESGGKQ